MRLLVGATAVCAVLGLAGAVSAATGRASARVPKLLSASPDDRSELQVRPKFMAFYHGNGGGFFDYLMGPGLTWGAFKRSKVVYALEPTRIPTNGVPGGLPAHTWCWAKIPQSCVSP